MGPDKTEEILTCSVKNWFLFLKKVRAVCKPRRSLTSCCLSHLCLLVQLLGCFQNELVLASTINKLCFFFSFLKCPFARMLDIISSQKQQFANDV